MGTPFEPPVVPAPPIGGVPWVKPNPLSPPNIAPDAPLATPVHFFGEPDNMPRAAPLAPDGALDHLWEQRRQQSSPDRPPETPRSSSPSGPEMTVTWQSAYTSEEPPQRPGPIPYGRQREGRTPKLDKKYKCGGYGGRKQCPGCVCYLCT